ncbi:substrate-binding periplasmic protein [Litorilituus lipolyticus]|uniref:Transporter substrate-binding domain-containing protein n=1 Tax=Litorilituus lipolyticus TaxID=2491017 RepID=A0A502LAN7_9GAMM|nr:transporter substrate-binding domain-containing protein [Litorilituus lipolyticus]TPH17297.1 transporter substrate-binding domain-containing protein [Litorilituus lipolyticus]
MKHILILFSLFYLFSVPGQASEQQLKVAMFIEPPFVDFIADEWLGENVEIIKQVTSAAGLTTEFIHCPFARCLSMVKNGQADIMMGLLKSTEREKDLIFIEPPYLMQHKPLRFFTLTSRKITINQLSDLEGLFVGTLRGGAYFKDFDENKAIKKIEVTSRKQLVKMLLKGHIDTFLEREETIRPLISLQEFQQKISLANYQFNQPVGSYIVFSKKSSKRELANLLSEQISLAIKAGKLNPIRQ